MIVIRLAPDMHQIRAGNKVIFGDCDSKCIQILLMLFYRSLLFCILYPIIGKFFNFDFTRRNLI